MTLGHVYDMDLKKNEMLIKEVIIQAQGEVRSFGIFLVFSNRLSTHHRWLLKSISNKSKRSGQITRSIWSTIRTSVVLLGALWHQILKLSIFTKMSRGWDDLFTKCSENLNSLTAMKLSPYYKGDPF